MTAVAPRTPIAEALELVDAAVYADVFGSAVTLEELWRYARRPVGRAGLEHRLPVGVLVERDGLYCLAGREDLLGRRFAAERRAEQLERRALRVARRLRHVPFVRGLVLTGSAAAGTAKAGADVDVLVVVADGRLSLVFTLLASMSRLTSRRAFCPNQYLAESALELERRDLYVAREVVQAKPLAGCGDALRRANGWVEALLPNAWAAPVPTDALPCGGRVQRALERPLRGRLGDRLERQLRRLAHARLRAHHRVFGTAIPPETAARLDAGQELRFHAEPWTQSALERYERRREELAARLARQPT